MLVFIPGRQLAFRRGRRRALRFGQNDGMQRRDHKRCLCAKPLLWSGFADVHLCYVSLRQLRECVHKLCGTTRSDTVYNSNLGHRVLSVKGNPVNEPFSADPLAGLLRFIGKVESGYLRPRRDQFDVTKNEVVVLKSEIVHLKRILGRSNSVDRGTPLVRSAGSRRSLQQSALSS
jgi:hypothetical protein